MKNINTALLDKARTSIFVAHRLRTIVESGMFLRLYIFIISVRDRALIYTFV
jgi:ABC-type transport system involved in Fe-S cluster assembly fused permease/ATPase subunit